MATADHRATARVMDIMELLATTGEGHSLTEIATALSAPKSSLLPIIRTMCDRGYLQPSPQDASRYCIGRQAYIVGNAYSSSRSARSYLKERMRKMVASLDETSQLGILSGSNVFYAIRVEGNNPIMLRSQVDKMLPAYCTGLGKSLLSDKTREQLSALYPDGLTVYTPQTVKTLDQLYDELLEVRRTGFAYEHSELVEGVECVAVPLCYESTVVAAASFSMPAYRTDAAKYEQARLLLDAFRIDAEGYFAEFNINNSAALL